MVRALHIGMAELIAKKSRGKFNDPQIHQIKYGERIFEKSYVIVKTPNDESFQEFDLSENVRVFPTRSRNRYFFMWDAWVLSRRIISRNKIDLIVLQDPFFTGVIGYLLKKEFHIPMNVNDVCDFIDNRFWIKEWWVNRVLNPIGKFILKRAESIRVDCQKELEKLSSIGIERKKIWNIPFILNDADKFVNYAGDPEFRRKLLGERFDHIVLFVGRFVEQKDLGTLFKTIQHVIREKPRTLFLIIGGGKKTGEIQKRVGEIGIQNNTQFIGWVDYFDLPKYYAVCDAFILTSKYETSPRVIIFACLSRKPIVTTDVSGVTDFVEEGKNGFSVPVEDKEGLAKGIVTLLKSPSKAKEMGEYGFKKVQALLDEEKILQNYQRMQESTLKSGMVQNEI